MIFDEYYHMAIHNLWCGVLTQAIYDALAYKAGGKMFGTKAAVTRQAYQWITDRTAGFLTVCDVADFDADAIVEYVTGPGTLKGFTECIGKTHMFSPARPSPSRRKPGRPIGS